MSLFKKISRINYNQGVLDYLSEFRNQLKHIMIVDIWAFIFSALIILPAVYIIMLSVLNGNNHITPIYNLINNDGFWIGLITGEIISFLIFLTMLYRLIVKTMWNVDQRIEEIKN